VVEFLLSGPWHTPAVTLGARLVAFYRRMQGRYPIPVTLRVGGTSVHDPRCGCLRALYQEYPMLPIVTPSSPSDAGRLLLAAIREPNPVVYIEMDDELTEWANGGGGGGVAQGTYGRVAEIPAQARLVPEQESFEAVIVVHGPAAAAASQAAQLFGERGVRVGIVDLRYLNPLDLNTLRAAVGQAGCAVVVDAGPIGASVATEVIAILREDLSRPPPVLRVARADGQGNGTAADAIFDAVLAAVGRRGADDR
jgi:pyruvate dehydrogenase E1 component beta subunit